MVLTRYLNSNIKYFQKGKLWPQLPSFVHRDMTELIESCFAFNPRDRPNFEEICQALETFHIKHNTIVPVTTY